ncbi:DNA-binding protein H-NS [Variovorax sp. HW608]|uniref:H-NS family nucleoid-associated regulatory protein n=1 Tax=Variovorax sp. HW608 TaxID=1034889 RepID=UPI00081FF500|nr:H-NS family nucleoid-associated regulatory protein [Variovorax sp. HW608]SCK25049.1 DNA-binding protein H-NS [Variovorax sp. HW608]
MANSYAEIRKKIAALQKEADSALAREVAGVVERIQVAIAHYGLTPEQLFGKTARNRNKERVAKVQVQKKQGSIAYGDGQGNTWGGWGKRPTWLREALAAGKNLEDFQLTAPATKPATRKKAQKRRPSSVLYSDGAGRSWTGRGPQPRWLKEAIAQGKTLEEMRS